MSKNNEQNYSPAYVERIITPEEMKRRAEIDKQVNKHSGIYNTTRLFLFITLLLSVFCAGINLIAHDNLQETAYHWLFLITFYGAWLSAALSLVFGLPASGMAKKLNSNKIAMKTIGFAVLAIIIVLALSGYVTEFFTESFPKP